jgi:hypothetical protein
MVGDDVVHRGRGGGRVWGSGVGVGAGLVPLT